MPPSGSSGLLRLLISYSFPMLLISSSISTSAQEPTAGLSPAMHALLRTDSPVIVLEHVTLFDGTGEPARHDQSVVIDHGRIAAVGPSSAVAVPANATVLDETGKTLLPGLVGMHEHLFIIAAGSAPERLFLAAGEVESFPRLYLAAGVTTARTTGSIEPIADLAIKQLIANGQQAGPDLDLTGPYLDGSGGHILQNQIITSPEDARETVDYWSKRGFTSFKAYDHISPENLQAAIDAAHAHGAKITGHLESVGFRQAISMGIDNIEHGILVDGDFAPGKMPGQFPADPRALRKVIAALDIQGSEVQSLIQSMVDHHVALTSTLAVFESLLPDEPSLESLALTKALMSAASWESYLRMRALNAKMPDAETQHATFKKEMEFEREFVRKGGLLLAGCDPTGIGGVVAGLGDEREMELLVQAGFSPAEAVEIYTNNGAKYLGRDSQIGTITLGKQADLLLLDGDFEHDVTAIEHPEIVFKHGLGWDSGKLHASVAGIVGER